MPYQIKELKDQVNDVKEELAGILLKIDLITNAINLALKNISIPELSTQMDDNVYDLSSLIQDTRNLQRELALLQTRLANYLDQIESQTINDNEVNGRTLLEVTTNGVKIIIFDEFPPKTSIYDRVTMKNGKLTNHAYAEARNRWYSLIKQAVSKYKGERIIPAIIYILYFVPKICDTGNFISKFIVDAMMYNCPIATDDNLKNVNTVIQEAVLDKKNPRTEIYVFKNIGQLDTAFCQNS